jgi:hypothetical protein
MEVKFKDIVCMEESSITVRDYRHRTTVPSKIFKHLGLKDKDKLKWVLLRSGRIIVEKG